MDIKSAIAQVVDGHNLTQESMRSVMMSVMTGEATPAQIAGLLVALRMKGETVEEISAAAAVMRELSSKVSVHADHLVDTCGTGGDGSQTFNISTAVAFVSAAAGAKVAKHGNRSISSKSGSADVLEAAGVNIDITPEQVAECIEKVGVGFLFAPKHHSAMKYAIGVRKEMAIRTIFNVLGPLTNPAGAPNQIIGVYSNKWVTPLAEALKNLGSQHVLVVHAEDGMDEISIASATNICELKEGQISNYTVTPEQFGLKRASLESLVVTDANESLHIINQIFDGQESAAMDIVKLNAGAAIYVAGLAESLESGINAAQEVIASGAAKRTLQALVDLTATF